MPRLHLFAQAHPDISLNLSAAHTHSDFALGQVDLDIRYGVPQWPDLVVEPLFEERIVPLASAAFIREHRLKRPEQLLRVPLIQSNVSVVQWSDWFAAFSDKRAPDRFTLRFDRAHMSLDAAAQGLGVALESTTTGSKHLAEGKLRPVLGHGQVDPREGALRRLSGAPCQAAPGRGIPFLAARRGGSDVLSHVELTANGRLTERLPLVSTTRVAADHPATTSMITKANW